MEIFAAATLEAFCCSQFGRFLLQPVLKILAAASLEDFCFSQLGRFLLQPVLRIFAAASLEDFRSLIFGLEIRRSISKIINDDIFVPFHLILYFIGKSLQSQAVTKVYKFFLQLCTVLVG